MRRRREGSAGRTTGQRGPAFYRGCAAGTTRPAGIVAAARPLPLPSVPPAPDGRSAPQNKLLGSCAKKRPPTRSSPSATILAMSGSNCLPASARKNATIFSIGQASL